MHKWRARLVRTAEMAGAIPTLGRSGLLGPYRPRQVAAIVRALRRYGVSVAAMYALGAARRGDEVALIDERGSVSFAGMETLTSTLAAGLVDAGVTSGDAVAMLCRNHAGFVQAEVALAKIGADIVYLNTAFAAPQLADVVSREGPAMVIVDAEFLPLFAAEAVPKLIVTGTGDDSGHHNREPAITPLTTFADLLAGGDRPAPGGRPRVGRQVILTSGTTGTPKGAQRRTPTDLQPYLSLIERIPLRSTDVTLVAAPMFHSWGLVNMALGMILGSTLVLRRRFDAEATLRTIDEHRATVLIAVPVMIQRIMELPEDVRRRYDTSSLRIVAVTGSAMSGMLARHFMNTFGDVLYSLYGATEVGWVSIATPADLRAAPTSTGRPAWGTRVRLLDERDREVADGATGRIFVRGKLLFEGYTGGGNKAVVDGYMSTGDVGHLDAEGRLYVDGREDDMIVSGGENVFPSEVESVLSAHPDVADVAVVGVSDDDYGQRLEAFVVPRPGGQVTEGDLRDYVRGQLANFKVPKTITLVEELPRNATGKVVKWQLAKRGG